MTSDREAANANAALYKIAFDRGITSEERAAICRQLADLERGSSTKAESNDPSERFDALLRDLAILADRIAAGEASEEDNRALNVIYNTLRDWLEANHR